MPACEANDASRFDDARGAQYAAHRQAAYVAGYGVTMNLMFWKKKPANDAPVNEGDTGVAPGLLARIKAALSGRLKSPPPFQAEVPASAEAGSTSPENAAPAPDAAAGALARIKSGLGALLGRLATAPEGEASPVRRKGLIAVGVMLLLLLLGAFGYAAWSIVRSSPDAESDVTELIEDKHASDAPLPITVPDSAPAAVSEVLAASAPVGEEGASAVPVAVLHAEQPASSVKAVPAPKAPLTEVEALRQKNAELQAQLEALKKPQRPSSSSVKLYPGDKKGAAAGGVATVGNSDPKAAAATLKEAIEAMNTGVNYQKKPEK